MLAWALRYAELEFHVFPCHEPLFDHPDGYLCSCEEWRHSEDCRQRDHERLAKGQKPLYLEPHQHCDHPGKHPRGHRVDAAGNKLFGLMMATTDKAQIRTWWGKWPNAPIGCVPGRGGLAVLDLDAYKELYAGADLLTRAEQETPTVLTGGGGQHLYYRKHEGATYSNAPGTLPAGIDVRADNGYTILPPSPHASGRRYQWEDGYNPGDLAPQLLPQHIHDVLAAASAKACSRGATFTTPQRWDGVPSTAAPDLAAWKLSIKTRQLIAHPAAKGKRSENDMAVVTALVYAGADDDGILAVFEHNPIGTAGKFAEGGRRYLELTIGAARAYAQEHPRPPTVATTIAAARDWLHSIDLAEYVPLDKQCAAGYRTRERDLAVADAILDVFDEYGSLDGPLGLRQLRALTNLGGLSTVGRALECLTPWFVRPVGTEDGADAANRYELTCYAAETARVPGTPPSKGTVKGVPGTRVLNTAAFSEYRAHDAFNATTTPITPEMIADREAAGEPYATKYTLTAIYRRRLQAALPGAGRVALVIVAALVGADGHVPRQELIGLGGRSKHTVYRAIDRLAALDLVTVDAAGGVDLRDDWQAWLENITELMPTAGSGRRRIARDALATLETCAAKESEAADAGAAVPGWVERRRRRAEMELVRLAPTFWRLHKTQIGASPMGHYHAGPNGQLLEEQLPELRAKVYGWAA